MSADDAIPGGRRSYDPNVDPTVKVYVEQRLTDTRHEMRNELGASLVRLEAQLAEIKKDVAESALLSTREHAEVGAKLANLSAAIEPIPRLAGAVAELMERDSIDEARQSTRDLIAEKLDRNRRTTIGLGVALAGPISAVAIALFTHH